MDVCYCCRRDVEEISESGVCPDCDAAAQRLDAASDMDIEVQNLIDEGMEDKVVWKARIFVKRLQRLRKGRSET